MYAGLALKGVKLLARRNPWGTLAEIAYQAAVVIQETQAQPQDVLFSPPSSYEPICDIRGTGGSGSELSSLYAGNVCHLGQYIVSGYPVTAASEWVSEITPSTVVPDGKLVAMWHRTAPATADPVLQPAVPYAPPVLAPLPDLMDWPLELPQIMPQIDPHSIKPETFTPDPKPVPYSVVPSLRENPYRDPVEQSQRGPTPEPNVPGITPGVPGVPPIFPPVRPGGPVKVHPPGTATDRRPPHRGEKERKLILSLAPGHPVARGLGYATEGLDLIEAFYDALPEKIRQREWARDGFTTPQDKLRVLYEQWDKLPPDYWKDVLNNIIQNEVEDQIIGRTSKAQVKAQAKAGWKGRPVGSGSGTGGLSGL